MTTITIPARDLLRGDRFDFCGLPAVVHFVNDTPADAPASTGIYFSTEGGDGTAWVTPDALVTVERTDPDAELVERMAQAMADADDLPQGDWSEVTIEGKAEYRRIARAALAVVRADQ